MQSILDTGTSMKLNNQYQYMDMMNCWCWDVGVGPTYTCSILDHNLLSGLHDKMNLYDISTNPGTHFYCFIVSHRKECIIVIAVH